MRHSDVASLTDEILSFDEQDKTIVWNIGIYKVIWLVQKCKGVLE